MTNAEWHRKNTIASNRISAAMGKLFIEGPDAPQTPEYEYLRDRYLQMLTDAALYDTGRSGSHFDIG